MKQDFGQITYGLEDVVEAIKAASRLISNLDVDLHYLVPDRAMIDERHLKMLLRGFRVVEANLDMADTYLAYEVLKERHLTKQKQKSPKSSSIGQRA